MAGLKRLLAAALAVGGLCPVLSGCQPRMHTASATFFAMDTVMTVTVAAQDEAGAVEATAQGDETTVHDFEALFSATREGSDIYALNSANGEPVRIRPETVDILTRALELCELTDGALDITAYPAVKAWGFTAGEYRVPDEAELKELTGNIEYTALELTENRYASLPAGMEIDLGAVAKGYVGDRLAEGYRSCGFSHALLDLGQSSIMTVGTRPDGNPWRIGIQDPRGEGYLGVLELTDMAMGTSGDYQRYFEQDGVRYSHIIDPATAAPARSGLASVTVVSPSCLTCDGLSTALFVMGLEKGVQFWRDHPELDFDVIFIEETGAISITSGLGDSFTLAEGYEDREVTVLS